MDLLPETFEREEQLLRAVLPADRRPDYWKGNRLSSAVFKDKKGLSVERTYDRSLEASVQFMRGHLSGNIASVTVGDCESTDAVVAYLPSLHNKYHSEIHGSAETKALNPHQARFLAERAQMVYSVSISTT